MYRAKEVDKSEIINIAKCLEFGQTCFKIGDGSVVDALKEARYYIEFGCSSRDYHRRQQEKAEIFFKEMIKNGKTSNTR